MNPQATAMRFGRAASTLPAINDRQPAGSAPPLTARFNWHKGNQRGSAECEYPNFPVSSAASIYNNPTTPYFCCQVVQRMGSTSISSKCLCLWSITLPRLPTNASLITSDHAALGPLQFRNPSPGSRPRAALLCCADTLCECDRKVWPYSVLRPVDQTPQSTRPCNDWPVPDPILPACKAK